MKSNYSELGEYIREVNERNSDLAVTNLLGVSMEKTFIQSVANLNGVDMSVYKVLRNEQLACKLMSVGRDEKLPVDLYREQEPSIVSSAYYVFEPKDKEELLPEYLMMWLCRPENDRYIGFISGGDVRGGISWETFCSLPIKVPSINKQIEIVKEYNVIQNRIALNQQLIKKLEETAQAIYREWFVEGIELENLPEGWRFGKIGDLLDVINGYAFSSEDFSENGNFPIIKITNIAEPNIDLLSTQYYAGEIDNRLKKCLVTQNDILISMTGSHMNQINSAVGKIGRYNYEFPSLLNQRVGKLKPKFKCDEFVFLTMLQQNVKKEILMAATGSANQANISPDTIKSVDIIIPNETILHSFENFVSKVRKVISNHNREIRKLTQMKDLLLSKLATIEN
jgi:type I restriction enzyme S subunit